MAVTLHGKGRARSKKPAGRRTKPKPKTAVKRRNAPAAALADPRYRKRVVKGVKGYSRKGKPAATEDESE